jgi:hypothetical protein
MLLALFSHMTFSLPSQKLTINNQAIYKDDSIDYSENIFIIFFLRTHGNARRIVLIFLKLNHWHFEASVKCGFWIGGQMKGDCTKLWMVVG